MKRREFIALLGGAAATWPLAARAQQEPGVPLVGLLRNTPSASFEHIVAALRRGLSEAGFVDARNVAIEQRWAEGDDDKLPALLADLVGRRVAVIVANTAGALAAKAAATTVPVVFATGSDPVRDGLVASLNRPGANFTGVTFISSDLGTKRLELLRQLVSRTTTMGMLIGPDVPETIAERADVQKAAQALGQQVVVAQATSLGEIAAAFTAFVERGAGSLFVGTGAFTNSHRFLEQLRERLLDELRTHRLRLAEPSAKDEPHDQAIDSAIADPQLVAVPPGLAISAELTLTKSCGGASEHVAI